MVGRESSYGGQKQKKNIKNVSGIPTVKESRSFNFKKKKKKITAITVKRVKKYLFPPFSSSKCFGIVIRDLIKLVTAYKTYSVPV